MNNSKVDKSFLELMEKQSGMGFFNRVKLKILYFYLRRKTKGVCQNCNKRITGGIKIVPNNVNSLIRLSSMSNIKDILSMVKVVCSDCEVKMLKRYKYNTSKKFLKNLL